MVVEDRLSMTSHCLLVCLNKGKESFEGQEGERGHTLVRKKLLLLEPCCQSRD